jgi:hypothetical protein
MKLLISLLLLVFSLAITWPAMACVNDGDTVPYERQQQVRYAPESSQYYVPPEPSWKEMWQEMLQEMKENGVLWRVLTASTIGAASLTAAGLITARRSQSAPPSA